MVKWNNNNIFINLRNSSTSPFLSKKYQYNNIDIIFNPEFLTEANAISDFENQTRIILGGPRKSTTKLKTVYSKVFPKATIVKTDSTYAEMVKYVTNSFLATKVSFANEMYEICEGLDVDYDKVIDLSINLCNDYYDKDSAIIDIGCASGETLIRLNNNQFANLYGVDNSKDMLDVCPKNIATYTMADNYPTSFPKMDVIICNWTLHFIKDKITYLQSIKDNLNEGGTFILSEKTTLDPLMIEEYHKFKIGKAGKRNSSRAESIEPKNSEFSHRERKELKNEKNQAKFRSRKEDFLRPDSILRSLRSFAAKFLILKSLFFVL